MIQTCDKALLKPLFILFQNSVNCDGAVLKNYLDYKFQCPQEGLNCESLAYEVVT